jgi:ABC-2 type transport system ATP-binding protein
VKITFDNVTLHYGLGGLAQPALAGVSMELNSSVTGLIGRNGAGKSSLMALLCGRRKPSSGRVLVDGRDPFADSSLASRIAYVSNRHSSQDTYLTTRDILRLSAAARPTWSQDLADHLMELFEVPSARRPSYLSAGQQSAFWFVLGFASRAPLTLLDEVTEGMDAVFRERVAQVVSSDLIEHPRTLIISTHQIAESEPLFEEVVFIDKGRVLLQCPADDLRQQGTSIKDAFIRLTDHGTKKAEA